MKQAPPPIGFFLFVRSSTNPRPVRGWASPLPEEIDTGCPQISASAMVNIFERMECIRTMVSSFGVRITLCQLASGQTTGRSWYRRAWHQKSKTVLDCVNKMVRQILSTSRRIKIVVIFHEQKRSWQCSCDISSRIWRKGSKWCAYSFYTRGIIRLYCGI